MADELGKVLHWYDKIQVAVVKLSKSLKVGDRIKIRHGEREFEDTVISMQLDHKDITSGSNGDEVAVKLSQKAKEGALIFPL